MFLSIVISSYNYAAYLPQAIESALNLRWSEKEVIVVDDGSVDESPEIIRGYGDRIVAVFQQNSGQYQACNQGFARSRGDVVLFLDADDLLDPDLGDELAAAFRPGVSKVQFQMKIVDAKGRATGALLPQYRHVPSPEEIRRWASSADSYPTPPGSGNAYARAFLEKIFPLEGGDVFADSYCLSAAPYYGDVITVAKPLVSYRVHGQNDGAMTALDAGRFGREVARAQKRFRFSQKSARSQGIQVGERAFRNSLSVLPYRLASLRLAPDKHPLVNDSMTKILSDCARAVFVPQGIEAKGRAVLVVWAALVAVAPRHVSQSLVLWRFSSVARPAWLVQSLRTLKILS